jgi:succinyl-CoA synthetase beta subunit
MLRGLAAGPGGELGVGLGWVGAMPVVSLAGIAGHELGGPRHREPRSREARPLDLYEYQGKQFFARYGIPVSPGEVASTVDEAVAAAEGIGYPVVVKAQVQVGGRGKAGGIKLAADADEVRTHAANILGMDIKGHTVELVWVELASDIAEEYYASFTLDRSAKKHLGMLSAQGGVEIEAVAAEDPEAIAKIWVDPVDGLSEQQARAWVAAAKLNPAATGGAVDILRKLYAAYVEGDADLVEINPLILKPTGEVHALDAKVTLDGSSMFRHPDYKAYDETQVRDEREQAAHDRGLQYVGLDGYVGVIANGAGLAMSTVDIVNQVGGEPANFLDIGGGASAEVMAGALEVINNDHNVRSIFINIFGGITKGEEVANGIVSALGRVQIDLPIVIRLDGTNADLGREILQPHLSDELQMQPTMVDAARTAVALAGASGGEAR